MIESLSHITFIVRDLERMKSFLEIIFAAEEVYCSGNKTFSISKEKFLLINGIWIAIMEGKPLFEKTYNHVAFKIADSDFEKYAERVKCLGLEFRESRNRVEGEGDCDRSDLK